MVVVGADLSTFFIDLVRLDYDTDRATWDRYTLGTSKTPKLDRIRRVAELMPRGTYWDDVCLVGIEQPAGRHGVADVAAIYGAVLQCVPERVAVFNLRPAEWRKACGLPGNCPKDVVAEFAARLLERTAYGGIAWPQDACDAYAIAYAARAINQTQEAA